ncbi:MAG: T9SS type A sorting domain-containing protein [Ignavibacteria bacterium]|nr:T9SS type A sorting domain-containing protein [Ignavibacteria bacterium]
MKINIFLLIAFAGLSYGFFTQKESSNSALQNYSDVFVSPNYRVYPSSFSQYEPEIVRHPLNPNIMFIGANTLNGSFTSEGVYVTTNFGNSWFGSDSCKGSLIYNHAGDPGPLIDKDGRFFMTHLGKTINGQFAHYSTDMGLTWSNQYPVVIGTEDKGDSRTDIVPSSAYYGRTYFGWVSYDAFPPAVFLSYTSNGGANWTSNVQVNNPPQRCQGAMIKIGANGEVYVCWAGVSSTSPFVEQYVGFAKSINGGQSFSANENIFPMNGIQGVLTQKSNIRVNGLPDIEVDLSGGTRNGWIYIVTTEKNLSPAGTDPDVIFRRSSDGGQTWSNRIRVNQDALNNGKIQYFPAMRVDEGGGINVLYYDDRRTTSDSTEVFLSRSTDGGNTWHDFVVSDHRFKPVPISGAASGQQGDNICLTSGNNFLWPVWMDNSSGIYQVWTSKIDINTLGIRQTSVQIPDKFLLEQNYPNPFNPATNIRFSIKEKSDVTMKIYNTEGKLIETLVEKILPAGEYEYSFNAASLNSGVYFVTLEAGGFSDSKKMILLK